MKKTVFSGFIPLVLLISILAGCNKAPAAAKDGAPVKVKKLVAGIYVGGSTYGNHYDDDNKLTGPEVELLRAVDERLPQYEIELLPIEYRSMFASLESSRVDLVAAELRRNDEREHYIHSYRGYNFWTNRIIVPSDNTTINGLDDMIGKTLGTSQGSLSSIFMTNYIEETGKNIKLFYCTNYVADLLAGRVDAFITQDYLVRSWNKLYADQGIQFKTVGPALDTNQGVETDKNVYFFFSTGNEEARNAISDAIYEVRKDGTLAKIHLQFYEEDRTVGVNEAEEEKYMKEIGRL